MVAETRVEVMGTHAHLAVDDDHAELLAPAVARLEDLASRWTRFDPASELSRLNAADGRPTVVSLDTATLVADAVDGWRRTAGRFDPSVHDAVIAAGYDRTFVAGPGPSGAPAPAPGLADVQVDVATGVVTLPPDVRLDLGGIGKGHAADRVTEALVADGATGAAVSIGGDARVAGECPFADGWPIVTAGRDLPIARLRAGGFCYSTVRLRRWTIAGTERHHLIDPSRGVPTDGAVLDVAVAAATATLAEVHATAAIVAGMPGAVDHVRSAGLEGFVIDATGAVHEVGRKDQSPPVFVLAADGTSRE
ncbi:MAG: FAD:protein FMN transferase [Actinomycetota bacterium]